MRYCLLILHTTLKQNKILKTVIKSFLKRKCVVLSFRGPLGLIYSSCQSGRFAVEMLVREKARGPAVVFASLGWQLLPRGPLPGWDCARLYSQEIQAESSHRSLPLPARL